jgi:shikimate 5-dehydrogenase/shikimate kinase
MSRSGFNTPQRDAFGAESRHGDTGLNIDPGQRNGRYGSVSPVTLDRDEASSDRSIVLVGRRGSGLSSFAVIASRVLNFRIVDVEANLKQKHGMGRAASIKAWGVRRFRDVAIAELEAALGQHHRRHVLLCGPEVTEPRGRALLNALGQYHPVIMINRDIHDILRHLRLDDLPEAQAILEQTQNIFRSSSNVEFFNLHEDDAIVPLSIRMLRDSTITGSLVHCERTLQCVTQDFTHFLSLLHRSSPQADQMIRPLELELRDFSTVLSLPVARAAKEVSRLAMADCPSDAVQLTVDLHAKKDDVSRAFQNVRRQCARPVIYHVEWQPDGSPTDEELYIDLFRHGLRLVPDYITIDLHCTPAHLEELSRDAHVSKSIGHRQFANSEPCPWNLPNQFPYARQAAALGCVAARFLRHAKSPSEDRDCVRFQTIVNETSPIPVSATNVGLYARSAAVSNPVMTPVVQPHLSLVNREEMLLTQVELMKARFGSQAYQALHFHLVGSSVDYSLSPAMHNTAFQFLGMQHTYQTRQTRRIQDLLSLSNDTCGGFSVTLPFKLEVMRHLDSMSDAAKAIQAVNTVIPKRHGANTNGSHPLSRCHRNKAGPITGLHGENTDWIALRTCIARHLSAANSVTTSTSAVVIGAGGMAKAAIYALIQLGVQHIFIWNRTYSKAGQVAEHFNELFPSAAPNTRPRVRILQRLDILWPESAQQPSIVVCTPPVHEIDGEPGLDFEVPNAWFQSPTGGVIIEVSLRNRILSSGKLLTNSQLSYKTPWTRLMQQAHDNAHRGWICVEPLDILIEQGCAQFELFTGYPAPKKRMTDCVLQQFYAARAASREPK